MENENIYQVFQESYAKNSSPVNSKIMDNYQYPPATQQGPLPDFQQNMWPPPVHSAYPGAELDFPGAPVVNNGFNAARPQQQFYNQEFYDVSMPPPLHQNSFMHYDANMMGGMPGNGAVAPPPTYPGPSAPTSQIPQTQSNSVSVNSWAPPPLQQFPGKLEPPPTPLSVVGQDPYHEGALPPDPFDPFAIDQPSSTEATSIHSPPPTPMTPGTTSRRSGRGGGKSGINGVAGKSGSVSKRRGGKAAAAASATSGSGGEDSNLDPVTRAMKERERRVSNNTRERIRIRDINEALTELGRVVMTLRPKAADKPQTKLAVLNMAVEVITHLEKKVRERNLNPAALALNRAPGGQFPPASAAASTSSADHYAGNS